MYVYFVNMIVPSNAHFAIDLNAANAILKNLLYLTPNRKLLYVTDTNDGVPSHTFEHLSCFLPGLLALGAHNLPLSHDDKQLHMWAAQGLAYTCWITYADHISGLGPDEMIMDSWPSDPHKGRWLPHVEHWKAEGSIRAIPPGLNEVLPKGPGERDYFARKNGYLLRPEVRFCLPHRPKFLLTKTKLRRWRAFICSGGRLATASGESVVGLSLRLYREKQRLRVGMLASYLWSPQARRMRCRVFSWRKRKCLCPFTPLSSLLPSLY